MKTYEYVNFGLISGIANTLGGAGGELVRTGAGIGNFFKRVGQAGWNVASNAANAVKTGVGNAIDYVKNDINSAGQAMQQGYQDALTNPNVNRFPPIQKQPAVASDGTVVKNENTPNWGDLEESAAGGTYDARTNTTSTLGQTADGKDAAVVSKGNNTAGVANQQQANANIDKGIAQKAAAEKAAAKKAQEQAAAQKAATEKAAQEQKATQEAKNNMSQNTQAVSGMKAILRTINSGLPLTGPQINFLAQNGLQGDAGQIQQWIQQHGG